MTKEIAETIANNFVKEYFYRYEVGDWRDIYNYKEDLTLISKEIQELMGWSYKQRVRFIMEILAKENGGNENE